MFLSFLHLRMVLCQECGGSLGHILHPVNPSMIPVLGIDKINPDQYDLRIRLSLGKPHFERILPHSLDSSRIFLQVSDSTQRYVSFLSLLTDHEHLGILLDLMNLHAFIGSDKPEATGGLDLDNRHGAGSQPAASPMSHQHCRRETLQQIAQFSRLIVFHINESHGKAAMRVSITALQNRIKAKR